MQKHLPILSTGDLLIVEARCGDWHPASADKD